MAWTRLIVEVTADQAEALSDSMMACGALATTIEQNLAAGHVEVFGEPGDPPPALWPHCLIDALIPLTADVHALMHEAVVAAGMTELPAYQSDTIADQDWVRITQNQFEPIAAVPGLWVVPTWHSPPDPQALNIRLDPGQAFGTGSHPTTQLCLAWLEMHRPMGQTILDFGCGSGILAIAARMLGAARVVGVDIDPVAVQSARDNAKLNAVDIDFFLPDNLPPIQFDGIVANILAAPLVVLAPLLIRHLKSGGSITLSGILFRQAEMVIEAYKPECTLQQHSQSEDWVCLSGIKG